MADTFDALLRTRLQQTGANRDTWGGLLNTNTLNLLAKSIAGLVQITVAGVDVTLTTNNGAEDQARYATLDLIGAPGAARNIIIPAVSKLYVVRNATGSTMTVKTSGGTGVAIADTVTTLVMCDGTNVTQVAPALPDQAADSASLGGIPAASWARLNAAQSFSKGQKFTPVALSMGATVTPDLAEGNVYTGVLTANTTLATPANPDATSAQVFYIYLEQAASGGPYTLGFSAFYDFLIDAPVMPTGVSGSLLLACVYLPALGKAICFALAEEASGTVNLSIGSNEQNLDLFRRVGSPAGVVNLNVTIEEGVVITSQSSLEPALDLGGGFASGSVINIENLGHIIGRGGDGGEGAWANDDGSVDFGIGPTDGQAGGIAINGAGAGVTVNITNASGRIWGGGGGGGGGGVSTNTDDDVATSGGGGGGAGMGRGGMAYRFKSDVTAILTPTYGARGRLYLNGTAAGGAAGSNSVVNGGNAGASGAGGDYGANGTAGTAASSQAQTLAPGAAGTAGKAVEFNSSTVTFVNGSGSPNVKGAAS